MAVKNNAKIVDVDLIIAAGFDPKTGLPLKCCNDPSKLKENIRKGLRIKDEQTAVNRYKWNGLPNGLTGQLLERILYYRGQIAFFYMEEDGYYYALPYALYGNKSNGTLDVYGRFLQITPLPFNGVPQSEAKAEPWIVGLKREPVYNIDEGMEFDPTRDCVLLNDYTNQISQTLIPRQLIQEPLLDAMAETIPMARTSLIANSGIQGMKVATEDEAFNVKAAAKAVGQCAIDGQIWAPITGAPGLEELTGKGTAAQASEYFLYLQSLENERLSWYGLENGGSFQKKTQVLQSEQTMNNSNDNIIYQDGLTLRKEFCEKVKAVFGLDISVEEIEQNQPMDINYNAENEQNEQKNGGSDE